MWYFKVLCMICGGWGSGGDDWWLFCLYLAWFRGYGEGVFSLVFGDRVAYMNRKIVEGEEDNMSEQTLCGY
uniref:Uncharacterized protein n=1 Tax=Aegilops tauschii subsp. strangulata TaxID=200361 RepID=A0A453KS47_AEGTS